MVQKYFFCRGRQRVFAGYAGRHGTYSPLRHGTPATAEVLRLPKSRRPTEQSKLLPCVGCIVPCSIDVDARTTIYSSVHRSRNTCVSIGSPSPLFTGGCACSTTNPPHRAPPPSEPWRAGETRTCPKTSESRRPPPTPPSTRQERCPCAAPWEIDG